MRKKPKKAPKTRLRCLEGLLLAHFFDGDWAGYRLCRIIRVYHHQEKLVRVDVRMFGGHDPDDDYRGSKLPLFPKDFEKQQSLCGVVLGRERLTLPNAVAMAAAELEELLARAKPDFFTSDPERLLPACTMRATGIPPLIEHFQKVPGLTDDERNRIQDYLAKHPALFQCDLDGEENPDNFISLLADNNRQLVFVAVGPKLSGSDDIIATHVRIIGFRQKVGRDWDISSAPYLPWPEVTDLLRTICKLQTTKAPERLVTAVVGKKTDANSVVKSLTSRAKKTISVPPPPPPKASKRAKKVKPPKPPKPVKPSKHALSDVEQVDLGDLDFDSMTSDGLDLPAGNDL